MNFKIKALLGVSAVALAASAHCATFVVNNPSDDAFNPAPNTLRWAINQNNAINRGANPTRNTIIIEPGVYKPAGPRPLPLTAAGQSAGGEFLPPIVGPTDVVGNGAGADPAHPDQDPAVVIDGSNLITPYTPTECPGATFAFDFDTGRWTATSISGTGPNVRGYYGAGLTVYDSHDVTFKNLKVQHFCSAFGTVRSNNVTVSNVKIIGSYGTAGMFMTGDNGSSGTTTLSFNNSLLNSVLLDNGDGFEFTRGTHDSVMKGNYVALTRAIPTNGAGNALEFATAGNNNTVSSNTFTLYTQTALTLGSGSGHLIEYNNISGNTASAVSSSGANNIIRYNTFNNNKAGITISGTGSQVYGNTMANNTGIGVAISSANAQNIRISQNSFYGNTGLGIDLGTVGQNPNDLKDTDTGANGLQNNPVFDPSTSDWTTAGGIVLKGNFNSTPNQDFVLELFASRTAAAGQGQVYIGSVNVTTDDDGNASFVYPAAPTAPAPRGRAATTVATLDNPFGDGTSTASFTATATNATGATSELSVPLSLTKH